MVEQLFALKILNAVVFIIRLCSLIYCSICTCLILNKRKDNCSGLHSHQCELNNYYKYTYIINIKNFIKLSL